ncbi:MAG: hypothetical protein ACLP5H_23585 [Desulfomonilaceae bacterium]
MATLEEFLRKIGPKSGDKDIEKSSALLPGLSNAMLPAVKAMLIDEKDAEAFEKKVAELVQSDEFIHEISETIGEPMPNESEDEFVSRGQDVMRSLLKRKLIK